MCVLSLKHSEKFMAPFLKVMAGRFKDFSEYAYIGPFVESPIAS
jgi:hypothetical protein